TGRTLGTFQLEREFARTLCRQIRPESIEELSVLLAMNRPGPLLAKLNHVYAHRKRSCDSSRRLNLFQDTFDVIIYQEQIMKLAINLAGMSPAESDLFRMAISQKDRQAMRAAIEQLKEKMVQRGFDRSYADHLSNTIEQFSTYAFNKSHSIAYATISYELAYIKTHFPKIFFKYYIDEHSSDKKKVFQAIQELRLRGFKVLCPSVNTAEVKENQFQLPLSTITGVGPSVEQMCALKSPFNSIDDFARKTSLPISTIQRLAHAGAFDCIYSSRAESLKAFNSFQKGYDPSLSEISRVFGKFNEQKLFQITEIDIANLEEQVYGFPLTPLEVSLEKKFAPLGEVFCSSRVLPVAVKVQSGYASDGITICKVDEKLSDGEYLIIFGITGKVLKSYKLSEVKSVIYEISDCFDEKDFEEASPNESVKVTLMGKKVLIESVRPLTDTYRIIVIN
ncbi:MAG: DNA polymerase III subunit alpha, partial [Pseudothermotoga sp.]